MIIRICLTPTLPRGINQVTNSKLATISIKAPDDTKLVRRSTSLTIGKASPITACRQITDLAVTHLHRGGQTSVLTTATSPTKQIPAMVTPLMMLAYPQFTKCDPKLVISLCQTLDCVVVLLGEGRQQVELTGRLLPNSRAPTHQGD